MAKPSDEDIFKDLFATLEKEPKPAVREDDTYDSLFATLGPAKASESTAAPDSFDSLLKTLDPVPEQQSLPVSDVQGDATQLNNAPSLLAQPPAPVAEQPQPPVQPAVQPQLSPHPPAQSQPQAAAFPTVQTPDGLVLGTNNLKFFSMPNYTLEQAKMIADNIKKSNAQVLAFQEVEGNAAMDNLMMPNFPGWKYKMNDTPDHQDVAFMWNPEAVTMNGEPLVYFANEELPDTPGEKLFPRAPLVAEFVDKKTGTPFKLVNLHLKSQFTPPGLSKEEAALWQERNTAHRMRQLQYVADLVDRLRESGMPVFVPGDFNFNLSGTGKVNKQLRDMINFGIRKLENKRGTPESEKKYSYDGGRSYRSNLDVIGYANVPGTDLSPAYEVETSFPGGGGPDHDIVASVWKAVNRKGLSPTDFAANPVIDPDASAAKTEGHDPAFVNNPYALDAINGLESAVQRFDKTRGHARSDVLNRSVTPWHNRLAYGAFERSKRPPSLSQLAFAPVSWLRDVFLPSGLVEKPKTSEEVKKGEGNAFTDFELSDFIPFLSSATSSPAKAIMKSFKNLDALRSGLASSLNDTGLGNYLTFKKWNGYEKNEVPDPKIDWQPALPQPMNIEDAQNIEHWFAGPSDQEPYLKREETDKRTPEEKWKDFLASDPENSGFDDMPEYEAEGKSPYIKTPDAPVGDKNFTPLLHVLNDVAYSTAAGFNSWLSSLANGAGVMVHAATDPIARATGLWNPEDTNFLQDAGRGLDSLKNVAEREVKNKDALYSTVSRHVGSIAPTLMMMAAGGAPAAPGLINPTAVTPLAAKMFATGTGSMAQTVSGAGEVYKTARELGGTHEQAMDAAGKAAIAGSVLNLAANYLAGPHGLFTAGRLSNNELLKKIFGAERWIERPLVSPYRLFKYATGMRWPRTYINALKTSRSSLDAGLRAYLQAYGNGEITRAAVQSSLPYREVGGDANATFLDKLLSKESLPTGKKLESLIPAFYAGAFTNLLTNAPQIAKNFKEGWQSDKWTYGRAKAQIENARREALEGKRYYESLPENQKTAHDKAEQKIFTRRYNEAMSRSPLGETLFPYASSLKRWYNDFMFGPRKSFTFNPLDLARRLVDSQVYKFRDYWDIAPKFGEGSKALKLMEQAALSDLRDRPNLSSAQLDRILNQYSYMPKSARERVKAQYLDAEMRHSLARVKGGMRAVRADRTAARNELHRDMKTPYSHDPDKVISAIDKRVKYEETPHWSDNNRSKSDNLENKVAFFDSLVGLSSEDRKSRFNQALGRISRADLPELIHELEIYDRAFNRHLAVVNDPSKSEKQKAYSRDVIQRISERGDPIDYLYELKTNQPILENRGTNIFNLLGPVLRRANTMTDIERLIYGK